jgi:hypothetical protein
VVQHRHLFHERVPVAAKETQTPVEPRGPAGTRTTFSRSSRLASAANAGTSVRIRMAAPVCKSKAEQCGRRSQSDTNAKQMFCSLDVACSSAETARTAAVVNSITRWSGPY